MFYLRNANSTGNADLAFGFGTSGDLPIAGNWDALPPPPPPPTATPTSTPTSPSAASASFTYDGDGKRVKSVINGTTTTYFVGAHYEVANGVVTKYYYAGAQRIAMRSNGALNYLLGDHLGSTSLTTDATGTVISELRYTAWGEVRYASGNTPTKYTYTGQYSYTSDFGLMFYNARWYDPYITQFSQPDSIIPDPYNPQAWNRYAYAFNNPVRYTDPSGHKVCDGVGTNGGCDQSGIPGTFGQIISALRSYGVKTKGKWSFDNLYAAYLGVVNVGDRLASIRGGIETSADAFKAVFEKGINLVWDPHCNGCRTGKKDNGKACGSDYTSHGCVPGGGFTAGNTITFASMTGQSSNDIGRMTKNVVHELGHAYYNAIGAPLLGTDFSRDALRPDVNGQLDWQQHPPSMNADGQDIPGELFADTFIAWTYNAWNTDPLNVNAVTDAQHAMNGFAPLP